MTKLNYKILINYSTSSCLTYSSNQLIVSIYRSVKGGPDNTCVGGGGGGGAEAMSFTTGPNQFPLHNQTNFFFSEIYRTHFFFQQTLIIIPPRIIWSAPNVNKQQDFNTFLAHFWHVLSEMCRNLEAFSLIQMIEDNIKSLAMD